jgi:ribulose 1,5-bisphosphate synthetase/thiazole synthase
MSVPIQNSCQEEAANMSTPVETDIFIVGAGPAGGSLTSFLAQNHISTPAFQKVTY